MKRLLLSFLVLGSFIPGLWADPIGFHCLDLSKVANRSVTEAFDQSAQNVQDLQDKIGFKNVPVGLQTFRGIPFQIIDPVQNDGLSFVVLKGHHQSEFPEAVSIPAGHLKAAELFFLHTCLWGGTAPDIKIGEYDIIYDDGQVTVIPLHVGLEISNFWYADDTSVSFVGWWNKYKNAGMGLSIFPWKNPSPNKAIQTILFKSAGKMPVPILFAVTAADQETDVAAVSPKPEKTVQTDTSSWLPFAATTVSFQGTALDMSSWVEAPAGKHGPVKTDDYEKLLFTDGTPVRFWGTLLSDNWTTWSADQIGQIAGRLASLGCNLAAVNMDNATLVPDAATALVAGLKAKGIYTCFLNLGKATLPTVLAQDPAVVPPGILNFGQAAWNKPVADPVFPLMFKDDPMVVHPSQSLPALLSFSRPLGSPYGVLWQDGRPNEFLSEAPLLMATYGLFENWDAVLGMKVTESDWGGQLEMDGDLLNKPALWLQWPLAALAYLRGDLKPGRLFVLKSQDPAQLKAVDQLKAVAHRSGFNPGPKHLKTDPLSDMAVKVNVDKQSFTTDSKQITWRGIDGLVSVESPRFTAFIGFVGSHKLNNPIWTVVTPNYFGSLCAISLMDRELTNSTHILIGGTTRMENTGMVYNQAKTKLMDKGRSPLLVEPLSAKITLKRSHKDPKLKVRALDANGKEISIKVPVRWSGRDLTLSWVPSAFYLEIYR